MLLIVELPWAAWLAWYYGAEILAAGTVVIVRFGNLILRGSDAILAFLMKSSGARFW